MKTLKFLSINQRHTTTTLPAKILDPIYSHVLSRSQSNALDSLQISAEQASIAEQETRDQSQNPFWHELRKRPLTASKFKRNEVFGLLEMKCLQCDSCKDAKCQLTLKRTHEYYFQVMGQMVITGLKWCDFMVFCRTDRHIETIFFDEEFFADMYSKLNLFCYNYFLPSL